MNQQHENSNRAASRRKATYFISFGLVGAAVLALAFFLMRSLSPNAPHESAQQGLDASANAAPTPVGDKTSAAAHHEATQPISLSPDLALLVRQMNDSSLSIAERQKAIAALVQDGSPEALAALKEAAASSPPEIRGAIAGALRACASPGCTSILLTLLHDPNESVAIESIRSLAKQASPEAATALGQVLNNPQQSSNLRCEAALDLGDVEQFGVVSMLTDAAKQTDDEDVAAAALKALGGRDFSETQAFFESFLRSGDASPELRVAAVEALGGAEGDPTAFLVSLLTDPDGDVRVEAAWALSALSATGNAGAQLLALLQTETDADVRLRLFQALRNQDSFDVSAAMALVQNEPDPSARIAGLDLLATALRNNPTTALQNFFDQTATAELKNDILTSQVFDDQQAAVLALTRAHTPLAMQALQEVAQEQAAQAQAAQAQAQTPSGPTTFVPNSAHTKGQ